MATTRRGVYMMVCCVVIIIPHTTRSSENIALRKLAAQSSEHYAQWHAQHAIDECINLKVESGCCSHTGNDKSFAWWRVDLQQLFQMDQIAIYYRDGVPYRLAGYQLYVSNTTDKSQGVLCFQDTSATIEEVQLNQTLHCPFVGRYVIIYNERQNPKRNSWYSDDAYLELCEVQIFGCPVGFYGNGTCTDTCPSTCTGHGCNPTTGHCFYCVEGKCGNMCDMDCPKNCSDDECHKTGFFHTCNDGLYGRMCDLSCPDNCENSICDISSGLCLECISGKYGLDCENTCPEVCDGHRCRRVDGTCETEPDSITMIMTIPVCLAALFFLATIIEAIIILQMRRKAKSFHEKASRNTELCSLSKDDSSQEIYDIVT